MNQNHDVRSHARARLTVAMIALGIFATAGFVGVPPAAADGARFYVNPTTVDVGDAISVQAITPCPTPDEVHDWQVNVFVEVGGVALSGGYVAPDGAGAPGQWAGTIPVGDLTSGGAAEVHARCYSPTDAAPEIDYDPVAITINRPPAFTPDRYAASVGTEIAVHAENPCAAPEGAPEWGGALYFVQGDSTLPASVNFDVGPDGLWNARIAVPPSAASGPAELSAICYNYGGGGLDHQWPPIHYRGIPITVLPSPVFKPSTTSLTFGNVVLGRTSAARAVTVSNSSGGTLSVAGVHIAGANPGDFQVVSDGCSGRTLDPNAQCVEKVSFRPLTRGARTARLSFDDNAPGSPQTVALVGRGCSLVAILSICL